MKFQRVLAELRELLAQLVRDVDMSVSSGHTDIAHISEALYLRLLNALYGWHLKDLNAEQRNFPAIDLADDDAGIAIQVTATSSLAKVKDTINTFIAHDLHLRYSRLVILVITKRQESYNQDAIDAITQSHINFDATKDIIDYRTLATHAPTVSAYRVELALSYLKTYLRGSEPDLADEDFNPPTTPQEILTTNLVPIRFPETVYLADLVIEIEARRPDRQTVRQWLSTSEIVAPSGFEVRGRQLLTFCDLSSPSPFDEAIDPGTVTPITSAEYYETDSDHENTFRSLLRLQLQQDLFQDDVRWNHEDKVFFFCPQSLDQDVRKERWQGEKSAIRTVFERKMNRDDPTKVLSTAHLAFSIRFLLLSRQWYASLVPEWFFSYGDDFTRSRFADEQLSRRKKLEKEHSVRNVFRFVAWWLANRREDDLLVPAGQQARRLEFGSEVCATGGRPLDEEMWAPLSTKAVRDQGHPNLF